MEKTKILAAVLTAGIIASLSGFVSEELYGHESPEKDAYPIVVADASAAPAAPVKVVPFKDLLAAADVSKGEKISKICGSCHTFVKGGPNGVGPDLYGVIGRARATEAGFSYSSAMKAKGGKWTAESINEFLSGPQAFVPGTKMTFRGLKKPEDRAALIKWLETLK